MPRGIPKEHQNEHQVHYLKGYLDAKIESFAVSTEQSVSVLSQRMGELLYPMGQRMPHRVSELRSDTPEGDQVERRTVEVGRSTPHSGSSRLLSEGSERNSEGQPAKTRKKWVMSAEARQLISERRKKWWADRTVAQRKALGRKIQRVKEANGTAAPKKRGRPKGAKNKTKEGTHDTTGSQS